MTDTRKLHTVEGRDAIDGGQHSITAAVNQDGSVHLMIGSEGIVISRQDFLDWCERVEASPRGNAPHVFSHADYLPQG